MRTLLGWRWYRTNSQPYGEMWTDAKASVRQLPVVLLTVLFVGRVFEANREWADGDEVARLSGGFMAAAVINVFVGFTVGRELWDSSSASWWWLVPLLTALNLATALGVAVPHWRFTQMTGLNAGEDPASEDAQKKLAQRWKLAEMHAEHTRTGRSPREQMRDWKKLDRSLSG